MAHGTQETRAESGIERFGSNEREARVLLTKALRAQNALAIENAVARATRNHVLAMMVRQLVFYEGKGELEDARIHKCKREWEDEIGASRKQVDTANRVGTERGLWTYEPGYRPRDRRPTGFYRLDLFAVMRLAFPAELERLEPELRHLEPDPLPDDLGDEWACECGDDFCDGTLCDGPGEDHDPDGHQPCPEGTPMLPERDTYAAPLGHLTEDYPQDYAEEDDRDPLLQRGEPALPRLSPRPELLEERTTTTTTAPPGRRKQPRLDMRLYNRLLAQGYSDAEALERSEVAA
jgi:hypothetical protein